MGVEPRRYRNFVHVRRRLEGQLGSVMNSDRPLEELTSYSTATAEQRRLAEDNFANSHPFLVLFACVFFAIFVLAVLIIDRLVTRAKRDAMQRGREWNFIDCAKAWISKRLSAVTL